jgi:hypothetical protein
LAEVDAVSDDTVEEVAPAVAPVGCGLEGGQVDQGVRDAVTTAITAVGQKVQQDIGEEVGGAIAQAVAQAATAQASSDVGRELAELLPFGGGDNVQANESKVVVLGCVAVADDFVDVDDFVLGASCSRGLDSVVDEEFGELAPGVDVVVLIDPLERAVDVTAPLAGVEV